MNYAERFFRQSDYWYNDGLKKANMRDLTGAVSSLKRSLQYNRSNIAARNLLGLVYYGRGEVVEALVEWIISKNLKSYENIANYYIKKVQESPNELEQINQAIKKYNQCLIYSRQNGEDLAIIQLKKVIQTHPTFLKAHQLLALLYLQTEQYSKARQVLRRAHKMDITNPITLAYMHELSQIHSHKVGKLKEEKEHTVTYSLGNETIIQPVSASLKDNASALTIVNIIIGIVLGAAVVWFLIAPTIIQNRSRDMNDTIVALSEEIAARDTQITVLREELDIYRNSNGENQDAIENSINTQDSYELTMYVKELYDGGETSKEDMMELLLKVNPNMLEQHGKAMYDEVAGELFPQMSKRYYKYAQDELENKNYASAVSYLEKVIKMDAEYDEGNARLLLEEAKQKIATTE